METIINFIIKYMKQKEDLVLVTITEASGSIPRGAGAKMLVNKDGILAGTIGGGAVEYRGEQLAKEAIQKKCSYMKSFSLSGDDKKELGMICGGNITVYIQFISNTNIEFLELCEKVKQAYFTNENSWLITDITKEDQWFCGFFNENKYIAGLEVDFYEKVQVKSLTKTIINGKQYLIEPIIQAGRVYIFGGGHVAQELVPVAAHVGFRCVVFDDRKEYANETLFPLAEERIIGDFEHISEKINITKNDYTAVMSRGHQYDYLLQKQLLRTDAYYIGVMGSRKKLDILEERLLKEGFSKKDLERFQSPIGTAILAETPAEIAISIVGELIRVRALKKGKV